MHTRNNAVTSETKNRCEVVIMLFKKTVLRKQSKHENIRNKRTKD